MATTGVVGIIKGKNPDEKIIALRADMDALPIKELNKVEYRSKKDGVMHACGHDVHTTCLLGAAKILNELKEEWTGTVKLIFQPGEEKNPGGANILIKEGVLENPVPQAIFALHVNPALNHDLQIIEREMPVEIETEKLKNIIVDHDNKENSLIHNSKGQLKHVSNFFGQIGSIIILSKPVFGVKLKIIGTLLPDGEYLIIATNSESLSLSHYAKRWKIEY